VRVTSYKTAINRTTLSAPLRELLKLKLIKGRVLDYGCGHGQDVSHLAHLGMEVEGFDPHWRTIAPQGLFQTITCTYVLNVLDVGEREEVLESIRNLLTTNGVAYISVRRDLKKDKDTSKGKQRIVTLPLEVIFKKSNGFCVYKLMKK